MRWDGIEWGWFERFFFLERSANHQMTGEFPAVWGTWCGVDNGRFRMVLIYYRYR